MKHITPFYRSINEDFTLVEGECVSVLEAFDFKFDMIFADPPYFLSNGGISIGRGKVVCVDKGNWDKTPTAEYINEFNHKWLSACKDAYSGDSRSPIPMISVHSVGDLLYRRPS